ncbi:MAG: SCO family protein [Thiovulaceae bacterium]|nr:SCO family protein [Sulfurimonadaceae bacterium]
MNKKLLATILLSLVLITSLLVIILPTIFTKNISRIKLNKSIDLELILNDEKDIKIIFFGYSSCSDICSHRLEMLGKFYSTLDEKIKKRVGVEFLDISSPSDMTLPNRFAKYFNNEFKGIYLDKKVMRNYTKEFNVYFAQSLLDKSEYNHTTNIYLVKKNNNLKLLKYIYNSYPYDFEQMNLDIVSLLNE